MTWILIVIAVTGTFTADLKLYQINYDNKDACLNAMNNFKKDSKGLGFMCTSTNTGEIIR
jgi:hypothetical protein